MDFVNKSLSLPDEALYDGGNHTELLLEAAKYNTYMETVKSRYSVDSDTTNLYIENTAIDQLHANFQAITLRHLRKLKKKYAMLIFDITYDPFYGLTKNDYIHEYRPVRGCRGCFKFLASSIIVDGFRYFIDAIPVTEGMNVTIEMERVIKMLIALKINIGICLLDRGLARNSKTIDLMNRYGIKYLGLYQKYKNVREIIKNMKRDVARMPFEVKGVKTTLVIIKTEKCVWTFVTNIQPRRFWRYLQIYRKRWNIETGFRVQDEARIKTKSTNVVVRYFLFLASMILYNAWKVLGINGIKVQFKRFVIRFEEFCGNGIDCVVERLGIP